METKLFIKNTEAEQCPKCKGYWLDKDELAYFLKQKQDIPGIQKYHSTNYSVYRCPKCKEHPFLTPLLYHSAIPIIVDVCSKCIGVWLDTGEFTFIKNNIAKIESYRKESPNKNPVVPKEEVRKEVHHSKEKTEGKLLPLKNNKAEKEEPTLGSDIFWELVRPLLPLLVLIIFHLLIGTKGVVVDKSILARWLMPLVSVTCTIVSLFLYLNQAVFLLGACVGKGRVIRLLPEKDSEGNTVFKACIQYISSNGTHHEIEDTISRSVPLEVNSEVLVYYDPANPQKAVIQNYFSIWLLFIITSIFGLEFGIAGLFVWFF
jgi:uncharacterized protein